MQVFFIIISLIIILYIGTTVRKGRLSIKESFYWITGSVFVLVLAIFPKTLDYVAIWLKIDYPPSLLFVLSILFLLLINFRYARIISQQQTKIIELAQNIAILNSKTKKKVNDK